MATRPRRETRAQRNVSMRRNARNLGQNQPFQGGVGQAPGIAPQGPMPSPAQGMQQCPPGQEPGIDQNTGARTCIPSRPNISGNVPVNNKNRAMTPKPGTKPKGY